MALSISEDGPWSGPLDPLSAPLWRRLVLPLSIVVLLAGWVILREADRLIGGLITSGSNVGVDPDAVPAGQTASIGDVTGIFALMNQQSWGIWAAADTEGRLATFVDGYVLGDSLFMLGYGVILWVICARTRFGRGALLLTLVADLLETLLLIVNTRCGERGCVGGIGSDQLDGVLAWVSLAKWGLLAVVLLAVLFVRTTVGDLIAHKSAHALAARTVRATIAAWEHRLTVLVVFGIGTLALAPFGGIFDQLPDVQRAWFGSGSLGDMWAAAPKILGAALLFAASAFAFWYFGRRRSERIYTRFGDEPSPALAEASPGWWIAVPTAALAVSVLATQAGQWWAWALAPALLAVVYFAAFFAGRKGKRWICGVIVLGLLGVALFGAEHLTIEAYPFTLLGISVVALVISGVLLWRWSTAPGGEPSTSFVEAPWAKSLAVRWASGSIRQVLDAATENASRQGIRRTTWLLGDALAVFALALAPLGLVRSLTGPVLAALAEPVVNDSVHGILLWLVLALLACPLVVWGGMALILRVDRALDGAETTSARARRALMRPEIVPDPAQARRAQLGDKAAVVIGAVVVGLATFLPEWFAQMGPVAVTVALLLAWSMIVGGMVLSLQQSKPLAVFRHLRLNSTPVVALMTVYMMLMSLWATPAELYGVRALPTPSAAPAATQSESPTTDARVSASLQSRFDSWLESSTACVSDNDPNRPMPLLLVAAEGGGARAAYWTTLALQELRNTGCLESAMYVASGISGGSVGLVVDQRAEAGAAVQEIEDLTSAAPLARGVTAMLAGDFVAAVTGVRTPTTNGEWLDRAGHIEVAWEEASPGLAEQWSTDAKPQDPLLVLNSADSVSGCRVSITQLPFSPSGSWTGGERIGADDCGTQGAGAASALEVSDVWPGCADNLRWSTAAMLSARFPFVTPGGRLPVSNGGGCSGTMLPSGASGPDAQLVDGGYSEGSGLGALSDLVPEILENVNAHNQCVREAADSSAAEDATTCASSALVMPIVVYLKNERGFEVDSDAGALAAEFLVPLAGLKSKGLQNGEKAWLQRLSDQLSGVVDPRDCGDSAVCKHPVVVISAVTTPAIAPPLGWTLSNFSRVSMQDALDTNCQRNGTEYPTLADLRSFVEVRGPCT